ncbi:hypothetical protein F5887DRAFT_1078423 [Amanita rubescens]|nr:hypothetical protein F5887DRAFT_1078423 [Amanita rubescens]
MLPRSPFDHHITFEIFCLLFCRERQAARTISGDGVTGRVVVVTLRDNVPSDNPSSIQHSVVQLPVMDIGTSIPTEILSEIFLLLRDAPIALHRVKNRSYCYDFPWAVGQVCRHWRSAFLSYSALWSTLSIQEPDHRNLSIACTAEMERCTAIYLRRSEPHPLTVIIRVQSSFVERFSDGVWDMLLSCSDQWKKLHLLISDDSLLNGLVSRRGKMPVLESLKLSMIVKPRGNLTAFEIAPRLTELELMHGEEERLGGWAFPWSRLTKLSLDLPQGLDFTDSYRLRTFLLQLQNVEELLFFQSQLKEGFGTLKCLPVRFACLRFLQIPLVYPGVFSWFEAPLLEDLLVFCNPFQGSYDPDKCNEELSSLVRRSSCDIRHLTLQDCKVEVAHSIMRALTSVERLCVKDFIAQNHGPDILQDIAEADDIYLPNLRTLQVSCCPEYFKGYASSISCLFEVRNRQPRSAPASSEISSLSRLMVTMDWTGRSCQCCGLFYKTMKSRAIKNKLELICGWPSFSVTGLNTNLNGLNPILTVCASAAGALIDLIRKNGEPCLVPIICI